MPDERLAYANAQMQRAGDLALGDEEINEAIANGIAWLEIAYDKLVKNDLPALYVAAFIAGTVNGCMMNRVMQIPDED